jgi:hypothetical protein
VFSEGKDASSTVFADITENFHLFEKSIFDFKEDKVSTEKVLSLPVLPTAPERNQLSGVEHDFIVFLSLIQQVLQMKL